MTRDSFDHPRIGSTRGAMIIALATEGIRNRYADYVIYKSLKSEMLNHTCQLFARPWLLHVDVTLISQETRFAKVVTVE